MDAARDRLSGAVVKLCKKKLAELGIDPDTKKEATPAAEAIKREMFLFRLYGNALRAIGDGIAWRVLGYDRAVVRLLCERATKQQVFAEGLLPELQEWAIHFDHASGVAILNSLTNCLAIGDVTVVRDDGSAEIVEVKSSNTKSGRKLRQKHKMSEVVTLLSTGEGDADDKEVRIEILPINPESGLDRIGALLSAAESRGWASDKVSNCLYVECFDFRDHELFEAAKNEIENARLKVVGEWHKRREMIIQRNSMDLIAFSPNCAPFSIFPFPTRTCVDLLIGTKCYVAYLNVNAVAREFEYRGWEIVKGPEELFKEGDTDKTLVIKKGTFRAGVPPADFMRMHMETLRPQTLISTYEMKLNEGPNGNSGFLLTLYEGESDLWN